MLIRIMNVSEGLPCNFEQFLAMAFTQSSLIKRQQATRKLTRVPPQFSMNLKQHQIFSVIFMTYSMSQ